MWRLLFYVIDDLLSYADVFRSFRCRREFKGKQRLVGIFNIRNPQIMALDPEFVKDILIKNFRSFHDNEFADFIDKETDPIFGNNPFMLKGNEWKEKRSEITPAFTASRVRN